MSNLLSLQNSKNQLGIGTNSINITSNTEIKDNSNSYITFNTTSNKINTDSTIEFEEETTLSTIKTNNISSYKLLYADNNSEINLLALSSAYNYLRVSNTNTLNYLNATPTILPINTSYFSWGSVLNSIENSSDGTVTVNTIDVENGQTLTITLNSATYTANVSSNAATVTIDTAGLQALTNGQSYTMTADVTDVAGNRAIQVTSDSFTVDTIGPTLTQVTAITTPSNNRTPSYIFTTNKVGTLSTNIAEGFSIPVNSSVTTGSNQTVTFNQLGAGSYSGKTITVTDTVGNPTSLTIPTFIIDLTAPTVTKVDSTSSDGSYKADPNQTIDITVEFSESVYVTGTPQLTLETGTNDAVVDYSSGSGSNTLTFEYTVASGHTSSGLNYKTTNSLDLNQGTIIDSAGNAAVLTLPGLNDSGSLKSNSSIIIDTGIPTITSVTSTKADGTYTVNEEIDITINFSENVTLSNNGTMTVTLETGTTDTTFTIEHGDISNSSTASGNYKVATGDTSSNLAVKTIAVNEPLIDNAGNAMSNFDIPSNNNLENNNIVIDTTPPVFSSVSPGSGSYINGANIGYTLSKALASGTVKFTRSSGSTDNNSPHTKNLAGDELNSGTRSSGALTNAPTLVNGTKYTIEFNGTDTVGNIASTVTVTNITFDTTNPIISASSPTSNSSVNSALVSYHLSEDLASGTITFTRTGGTTDNTPHTQNLAGSELDEGNHNNITLQNAPILVNGAIYTIAFNGIDKAGNNASQVSVTGVTFDTTAPTVTKVDSTTSDGSYKVVPNQTIDITVEFSESVYVTGTPQLTLETGTNDAVVDYSSGSGSNTLTFEYTVASGHTSSGLNYKTTNSLDLNQGTIIDSAGNAAVLTLPGLDDSGSLKNNSSIIIDTTAPTITSVTSTTPSGTYNPNSADINITIHFSENVTLSNGSTIIVTLETGTTDRTVTIEHGNVSNSSTASGNYDIQGGDTSSALTVKTIAVNGSLTDNAGNAMTDFSIPSNNNLEDDKNIVIVSNPATISSLSISGDNTTITVTFNETIYNTASGSGSIQANDFVLSLSGGVATLVSTTPTSISSTSGNTYILGINISGTPNGSEVLTVNPNQNSIYNSYGIPSTTNQSNNTVNLTTPLFSIKQDQFLTKNSKTDPLNDTITSIPTWSTSLGDTYLHYETKTGNWYNINNQYLILDIDFTTPTSTHADTTVIAYYGNYDDRGGYALYFTGASNKWPNIQGGSSTSNRLIMTAEPKPWQADDIKKTRTLNNVNNLAGESSGNWGLHYDGLSLNTTYNIKIVQGIGQKLNEQYLFIDGTLVARQDDFIESDITNTNRRPSSNQTSGTHYFRIGNVGYSTWPLEPRIHSSSSIKINNYYIAESTNLWNNLLINTSFSTKPDVVRRFMNNYNRFKIYVPNVNGSGTGAWGYTWFYNGKQHMYILPTTYTSDNWGGNIQSQGGQLYGDNSKSIVTNWDQHLCTFLKEAEDETNNKWKFRIDPNFVSELTGTVQSTTPYAFQWGYNSYESNQNDWIKITSVDNTLYTHTNEIDSNLGTFEYIKCKLESQHESNGSLETISWTWVGSGPGYGRVWLDESQNSNSNTHNEFWIIGGNPYDSTEVRTEMWNQNPTLESGEKRGEVGYAFIVVGPDAGPKNMSDSSDTTNYPLNYIASVTGYHVRIHHGSWYNGTTYVVHPDGLVYNSSNTSNQSTWYHGGDTTGWASTTPSNHPDGTPQNREKWKILKLTNGNYKITNMWQTQHPSYNTTTNSAGHLNWCTEWTIEYNSTDNGTNVYRLKAKVPFSSNYTHTNNKMNNYLTIPTAGISTDPYPASLQWAQWKTYKFQYAYSLVAERSSFYGQKWTFNFY